jgi:hypothetical protein
VFGRLITGDELTRIGFALALTANSSKDPRSPPFDIGEEFPVMKTTAFLSEGYHLGFDDDTKK